MLKKIIGKLSQLCAYTHILKVISDLLNNEGLSEQTKAGRNIALLGFFCPFFLVCLIDRSKQRSGDHACDSFKYRIIDWNSDNICKYKKTKRVTNGITIFRCIKSLS